MERAGREQKVGKAQRDGAGRVGKGRLEKGGRGGLGKNGRARCVGRVRDAVIF